MQLIMSELCHFKIVEQLGDDRDAEPVAFGVILEQGLLGADKVAVVKCNNSGRYLYDSSVSVRTHWPDGTAQWLFVEFSASINANASNEYSLHIDNQSISLSRQDQEQLVHSIDSLEHVSFDSENVNSLLDVSNAIDHSTNCFLIAYIVDKGNRRRYLKFLNREKVISQSNALRQQFSYSTDVDESGDDLEFNVLVKVNIFNKTGFIDIEVCIHNSRAAEHQKGLWDLGDPASIEFTEVGIEIQYSEAIASNTDFRLILNGKNTEENYYNSSPLSVTQKSSGGSNSHSRVHINKNCLLPSSGVGYEIKRDGDIIAAGARANPTSTLAFSSDSLLSVYVPRFWQEFPTAVRMMPKKTDVALFADTEEFMHELQPGERKRRHLTISLSKAAESNSWMSNRLTPPHPETRTNCQGGYFQRAISNLEDIDQKLANLIVGTDVFESKRELIDEYGWRNFGDVFADHENHYRQPDEPLFISHYNNQYDLILGFGLQYLRSSDNKWLEFMGDLARHVVDIDIYHTTNDRIEYNNGLFWHTNHYVDAATATHRAYSKSNYNAKDTLRCSGGPSTEHCYTTGLALHYLLTGDVDSKDTVLKMAKWIKECYSGDCSLLGQLHSIAKFEFRELLTISRRRSERIYRYPFTRGTGNLLVALLDAFLLTNDRVWLNDIELVIQNTLHPEDNPADRNLENVEATWSHTVLMQSILRYLSVKEDLNELDERYWYARSSFLLYAKWTLEHGEVYLDRPERLEFVNDTWAAQDIRRYVLMSVAAEYDVVNASQYRDKAEYFGTRIVELLSLSPTSSYTRIQAIIMQNVGYTTLLTNRNIEKINTHTDSNLASLDFKEQRLSRTMQSMMQKILVGLKGSSLKKEVAWLRHRLSN